MVKCIICIYLFLTIVIEYVLYYLGFKESYLKKLISNFHRIMVIFTSCLVNSPKLLIKALIFRLIVLGFVNLLSVFKIDGSFIYIGIVIYIAFVFILSKDKFAFFINLLLIFSFFNCLSLLVSECNICELMGSSYKVFIGEGNESSSGSPIQGSNPGLNNSGGPNPPQGDGGLIVGAIGTETNQNNSSDSRGWSKAGTSTGHDYGSDNYVSSDDYSEYNSDEGHLDRGMENEGFVAKSHKKLYKGVKSRIESLKAAKGNDPDHHVDITGLKPQANVMHSPILKSLQIDAKVWAKATGHLNEYVLDKGFIKFKPADDTEYIDGKPLAGLAKLESKGSALYEKQGKWQSLTNNKLESVIKKPWDEDAFSSSWPPLKSSPSDNS